jgi:hypothetical protein
LAFRGRFAASRPLQTREAHEGVSPIASQRAGHRVAFASFEESFILEAALEQGVE